MPERAGVVSVYMTHAHRSYNFQDFPCLRTPPLDYVLLPMKYERWNKTKNAFEHIDMTPEDFKLFLVAYDRVKAECEIEDRTAEMKLLGNKNYIYD